MATKYKKCAICGHNYPSGHPCITCQKKGVKGNPLSPEQVTEYVKILRVQPGDTIVFKNMDFEIQAEVVESLSKNESLKDCNVLFIEEGCEIIIVRQELEDGTQLQERSTD